jgi:hypothetical protein
MYLSSQHTFHAFTMHDLRDNSHLYSLSFHPSDIFVSCEKAPSNLPVHSNLIAYLTPGGLMSIAQVSLASWVDVH